MRLSEVLEAILQYSRASLAGPAKEYMERRAITDEALAKFEIGYVPFSTEAVCTTIDPKWVEYHKLGCVDRASNKLRFLHEGRIVFPVRDAYGNLVALQGRRISDDDQLYKLNNRKYWHNSFNKSRIIYNLNNAIPSIRKTKQVIVTEGQFDVVRAWQCGIENIVCTSSTVLNDSLIALIARYANEAHVIFDNDAGGNKAIAKLREKRPVGLRLNIVTLPSQENKKQDLDMFLRDRPREEFERLFSSDNSADPLLSSFAQL